MHMQCMVLQIYGSLPQGAHSMYGIIIMVLQIHGSLPHDAHSMYGIADPWQRLLGCVTVALLRTAVLLPAGTTQPPTHWTFCMSVNMTQVKNIQLSCSDHLRLVLRTRIPFDPDSVRSV